MTLGGVPSVMLGTMFYLNACLFSLFSTLYFFENFVSIVFFFPFFFHCSACFFFRVNDERFLPSLVGCCVYIRYECI